MAAEKESKVYTHGNNNVMGNNNNLHIRFTLSYVKRDQKPLTLLFHPQFPILGTGR